MKRAIVVFVLLFMVTVLSACAGEYDTSVMEEGFSDYMYGSEIGMKIEDEAIFSDTFEINIYFINNSGRDYTYGEEPYLEVLIGEKWYTVPKKSGAAWDDVRYTLPAGKRQEYVLNISEYYELRAGHTYRFAKIFGERTEDAVLSGVKFFVK